MIPTTNTILSTELEVEMQPSRNYKMYLDNNIINGSCDELEAMKQVIYKILNTERYENIIYSWNYGIELQDLYGEHITYVLPELERRITEALIQDDRIELIDDFKFDTSKKRIVNVTFTVNTIFGSVNVEKEVSY